MLWVALDGAVGPPPDLTSLAPDGSVFVFAQSIFLPEPAEALAKRLSRAVFPPAVLDGETAEPRAWRYAIESQGGDTATLRWSRADRPDGPEQIVGYNAHRPCPGLLTITAEAPGLRETRLLALQPQDASRSALHLMVALDGTNAAPARRAVALWGRRLRWFLENGVVATEAYMPWLPEERTL